MNGHKNFIEHLFSLNLKRIENGGIVATFCNLREVGHRKPKKAIPVNQLFDFYFIGAAFELQLLNFREADVVEDARSLWTCVLSSAVGQMESACACSESAYACSRWYWCSQIHRKFEIELQKLKRNVKFVHSTWSS